MTGSDDDWRSATFTITPRHSLFAIVLCHVSRFQAAAAASVHTPSIFAPHHVASIASRARQQRRHTQKQSTSSFSSPTTHPFHLFLSYFLSHFHFDYRFGNHTHEHTPASTQSRFAPLFEFGFGRLSLVALAACSFFSLSVLFRKFAWTHGVMLTSSDVSIGMYYHLI